MIPLSILDLASVVEGSTVQAALQNSRDLIQHAERWGYTRFWVAEHHNMQGIASAATPVVIGYLAEATQSIRVGSGGVMLPNHTPYIIAEQFGTLASLYPGRIDLGVGRAPGTDQLTLLALRRDRRQADNFPADVLELQSYFAPEHPGQKIFAVPGVGTQVPLWILGSSLFGAELAARLGLPYAFASHFAPAQLMPAIDTYRSRFQASPECPQPQLLLCVNAVVAETDAEAARLFTSMQQQFVRMVRDERGLLPPPRDTMEGYWSPAERRHTEHMLAQSFIGSPETVLRGLREFVALTRPDELMINTTVFDHQARLRSYELLAELWHNAH